MIKRTGGNTLLDPKFILGKARIKEKDTVGDLGCGSTGYFVFPISKMVGHEGSVYAIDILKTNLENISKKARQENTQNINTVWSDLEIYKATKIDNEKLDVILLVNTLYLSQKRAEMIRDSLRMLKKGGRLLVVEWEDTSLPFGPPTEERVRADNLKKVCKKFGLKVEEEFDAGDYHYGIRFIKI